MHTGKNRSTRNCGNHVGKRVIAVAHVSFLSKSVARLSASALLSPFTTVHQMMKDTSVTCCNIESAPVATTFTLSSVLPKWRFKHHSDNSKDEKSKRIWKMPIWWQDRLEIQNRI
jgi:hypothetical protein